MKTVSTPKGTSLPLINLKGKDYLMVAHRLIWFNEVMEELKQRFEIVTEFLSVNDDQTIAKATVTVFSEMGAVIKKASATKRETKKDFPDHTEKAETSAIGRALALLGYGTQFAIADLDEGERIVDSPVVNVKSPKPETTNDVISSIPTTTPVAAPKKTTFRKPGEAKKVAAGAEDWNE